VSGDEDFFLGADPNRVVGYVRETCLDNRQGAPKRAPAPTTESRTAYAETVSHNPFADLFKDQ